MSIFQSNNVDVMYTDEDRCRKLGALSVKMPYLEKDMDGSVEVSFRGTEIHIMAHDVESGSQAETVVEFLGD